MAKSLFRSGCRFACLGYQRFHPLTDLGAYALPVFDTVQVEAQTLFLTARYRIEKTEPFDVTAIAGFAAVRHHYVVERLLFGTAA
jgi:hypothetical protein